MISGLRTVLRCLVILRPVVILRLLAVAMTLLVPLADPSAAFCQTANTYPAYTAQGIVNAATQTVEALAPNTIATVYGSNLSFVTDSITPNSLVGRSIPNVLDGVTVTLGGWLCNLFFVSPTQINFLVPYQLIAGNTTLVVTRQGSSGPSIPIQLNSTSPGLFVANGFAIAVHLNGTLVSPASPAMPGEIIVMYVNGLGRTTPDTVSGTIVSFAATIVAASQLQVILAGQPCPPGSVLYAGLAPGFAGLYQINLVVPPLTPPDPEIRIAVGAQISPPGLPLAVQ